MVDQEEQYTADQAEIANKLAKSMQVAIKVIADFSDEVNKIKKDRKKKFKIRRRKRKKTRGWF
jgi:hypothetical protein